MELPRPEMDAKNGILRHIYKDVFVSLSRFIRVWRQKLAESTKMSKTLIANV
jgi:hypothetical protein